MGMPDRYVRALMFFAAFLHGPTSIVLILNLATGPEEASFGMWLVACWLLLGAGFFLWMWWWLRRDMPPGEPRKLRDRGALLSAATAACAVSALVLFLTVPASHPSAVEVARPLVAGAFAAGFLVARIAAGRRLRKLTRSTPDRRAHEWD